MSFVPLKNTENCNSVLSFFRNKLRDLPQKNKIQESLKRLCELISFDDFRIINKNWHHKERPIPHISKQIIRNSNPNASEVLFIIYDIEKKLFGFTRRALASLSRSPDCCPRSRPQKERRSYKTSLMF